MKRWSLSTREIIVITAIFSVIAFLFTLPIFFNFSYWGIQDWDQHFFYHAVPRRTILEYHQFPLWNPYYCGGTVMLANPQSRFLSPTFLLNLLFGEIKGLKLEIWFHFVIGMIGMYLLGRHYGLDRLSAGMPVFVYMLSSMHVLQLTVGMTVFLTLAYLPWVFLFYLKGFKSLNYSLLSGLILVLMFFGGGVYLIAITLLFLAVYSLTAIPKHGVVKIVKNLGLILIFALLLSAVKLLPSITFMHEHPRKVNDYSGYSVDALMYSLFNRDQSLTTYQFYDENGGFWHGMSWGMDENGMYIGIIPTLLFLLGILLHRKHWQLSFCFFIFLWLSFGDRAPLSLWKLVHIMPIYQSMRVAQRFRGVFMLIMAIFSGLGLFSIRSYVLRKFNKTVIANLTVFVILSIVLVDFMLVNSPIFKEAFQIPPLETKREENFYQINAFPNYDKNGMLKLEEKHTYSSWSSMYPAFLSNIGTIQGYETLNIPRKAIPKDSSLYKGEVSLYETEGKVLIRSWSPNKVVVEVNVSKKGYLVLNQNYYIGWKAKVQQNRAKESQERKVVALDELIGVEILPQDKIIELSYLPTSFIFGLLISIITALLCIIVLINNPFKSF